MRLSSSKYESIKRALYIVFLIGAGSLLVSYRHSTPLQFYQSSPGDNQRLEEHHGRRSSVNLVEEWRMVLEGTEEHAAWKNRTRTNGNRTDISDSISISGEVDKTNGDANAKERPNRDDEMNGRKTLPGRSGCKQDLPTLPNMAEFYTAPVLNFSPTFNETVTDYYVTVNHDVICIQVRGTSVNCQTEVRLTDRYGPSRVANYTLGVGLNKMQLHVVDLSHSEPWILNTYTLNIYRQHPGELNEEFDDKLPHQDCGLRYLIHEPCDLQLLNQLSWQAYKHFSSALSQCRTGSVAGQWVLPCLECHRKETCYWSEAVWQPSNCTHRPLSRQRLREECLSGKKILFIGDSTLRGMMHYLMEQTNGSLTECDKTHDEKLYNINNNRTTVAFTYYPQFWQPANHRPLFDDQLLRLMNKHELNWSVQSSLANNRDTVLVVGGVHWLSIQHLSRISGILRNKGLSKIRVIVKTLGAGFHLQVHGLHHLTLNEQRRLALHNRALISFAASLGFDVVDTFTMTMARYKDFVEGKCACHFHRVKEMLPSFANFLRSSKEKGGMKLTDMQIQFHIEGAVNAVYSELLLNQICDGG